MTRKKGAACLLLHRGNYGRHRGPDQAWHAAKFRGTFRRSAQGEADGCVDAFAAAFWGVDPPPPPSVRGVQRRRFLTSSQHREELKHLIPPDDPSTTTFPSSSKKTYSVLVSFWSNPIVPRLRGARFTGRKTLCPPKNLQRLHRGMTYQ